MPRKSSKTEASPTTAQPSLLDTPRAGTNAPEFTVTELSRQLKRTIEDSYGQVRVRGEISECKLHSSGHLYITLKDENAILSAVRWRMMGALPIRPEIGMEVVCTGRLTTYAGQSKYQLVIEGMALAGLGALLKMLEERRKKLEAEGLFDPSRKQLLPYLPDVIGIVTSPTGAVIRDIMHRLNDRFSRRVLLWPVAVQGEGAAAQVAAAIEGFNNLAADGAVPRPDVIIVARGGGSVEDLMAFNEENVVRAIANSMIPIISAVGHETDTTLADYAADVRAPTPTAAAEMAVPVRADLIATLEGYGARQLAALRRMVVERKEKLGLLGRALGDPKRVMEPLLQRLDERSERLALAWQGFMQKRSSKVAELGSKIRHPRDVLRLAAQQLQHHMLRLQGAGRNQIQNADKRLERLSGMLQALSPRSVLGRGYGLIYNAEGHVITEAAQLQKGSKVRLELQDGSRRATVDD